MIDELHTLLGHVRSAFSLSIRVQRTHFPAANFKSSALTCERVPKSVELFPSRCVSEYDPISRRFFGL